MVLLIIVFGFFLFFIMNWIYRLVIDTKASKLDDSKKDISIRKAN